MSIRKKIVGVVVGWIVSMLLSLVGSALKRAMAKAQEQQRAQAEASQNARAEQPRARPTQPRVDPARPQPYKNWGIKDTIWQGMPSDDLLAAYGQPQDRSAPAPGREVWTYAARASSNDNGIAGMVVTLEDGVVTSWTEATVSA